MLLPKMLVYSPINTANRKGQLPTAGETVGRVSTFKAASTVGCSLAPSHVWTGRTMRASGVCRGGDVTLSVPCPAESFYHYKYLKCVFLKSLVVMECMQ